MSNVFEVTDPRGYQIVCSESAWEHITGNHASLVDQQTKVQQALTHPTMGIYQDAQFADRQVYYGFEGTLYLKVVVSIGAEKRGDVVTAYLTNKAKAGEKLLWLTSSS